MLSVGILTFLTRFSFIYFFEKWQLPEYITRALRFVPIAALTAILIPEITMVEGELAFSIENMRLLAGTIAVLVAWRTKNTILTIALGMLSYWALNFLF
jgi:branched-subunit amino acid transport protein